MDTVTTPQSRIEAVLQAAEVGLTVHTIMKEAGVSEKEAKTAIKDLFSRGQVEAIPTPGRYGYRYAWLAAKNPLPKVATPETLGGKPEPRADTRSGPLAPDDSSRRITAEQAIVIDDRSKETLAKLNTSSTPVRKAFNDFCKAARDAYGGPLTSDGGSTPMDSSVFRELVESQVVGVLPTRWAVAVPKRPLRIVKTRARAEALALSAVRRGAKDAEVFALMAVGRARRDAVFMESGEQP